MNKPLLSLVVIRARDLDRAAAFYGLMGITFEKHRHGSGPYHLSYEHSSTVFEIYPRKDESDSTAAVRVGFAVLSVDVVMENLVAAGVGILSPAQDSPWGRRAVVEDPDGHRVELTERSE